jgi:homocysteine S-methyltransferase
MKLGAMIDAASPVLLDGGLATELERRGHDLDDPLWSARVLLEQPEAIVQVHRDYLEAGADIVTTATYQATFVGLAGRGLDREATTELLASAVALARRACDEAGRPDALVAASIGPYGAFLADGSEYRGDYGLCVDALVDFHGPRLDVLAPLCDVVACETIPCLAEAQALARLLPGLDAWVSFSCRDAQTVSHGEPLSECIAAVPSATAVGVNCIAPALTTALLCTAAKATDKPLVAYPNAGEIYRDGWSGRALGPTDLAALAPRWYAAGARLIGGCCRTTPAHIRELARWRDSLHTVVA